MSALLISYDLNRPGQGYSDLHEAIKSLGTSWWHYLDSTWIVSTSLTPTQAFAKLQPTVDTNDSIFIVDITADTNAGWLPAKAWEWIKKHV
jgi:hypothetical protein